MKIPRWIVSDPPKDFIESLSKELRISTKTAKLLYNRNIKTYEDAERFFCPDFNKLFDPFLILNMNTATSRILKAIENKERIMIYGDYDVDGTTATAMLYTFLQAQQADVIYYINDRETEGYGISSTGAHYAKDHFVSVTISVDCGITAIEQAQVFSDFNIDLIICDHHEPKEILPWALAILNAKQLGCSYPFKELSGCGITFKLIHALLTLLPAHPTLPPHPHELSTYLDFVTLATAADIVDLTDENRILMAMGISKIKQKENLPFIKALADTSQTNLTSLSVTDIVFRFAPRINAAGRLEHAKEAIQLMLSKTYDDALIHAQTLTALNSERQSIQKSTVVEAEHLASTLLPSFPSSIVVYKEGWHIGILGIVAARLVETYYLPAIVLTEHHGVLKGSGRSVRGLNLFHALTECHDVLIQFGGHEMAAGLTIEINQLENFRKKFDSVCNAMLDNEDRKASIYIDAEISLDDITPNFLKTLKRFEPCGPKNNHPVFLSKHAPVFTKPKLLKNEHLKFQVYSSTKKIFDVVGFGFAMMTCKKAFIRQKAAKGDERAINALKLIENANNFLSTIQIGITLIGVLTGMFGGATLAEKLEPTFTGIPLLEPYANAISFSIIGIILTYLSLTLGELVPKRIALYHPDSIALHTAGIMLRIQQFSHPFVVFLARSTDFFLKILFIKKPKSFSGTEKEIIALLQQGQMDGDVLEIEKKIIERVFRLADTSINTFMTPRANVVWIDIHHSIHTIREKLTMSRFSYYPLINEETNDMLGIIATRDIIPLISARKKIDLTKYAIPPLIVSEHSTIISLLTKFKKNNSKLAFVVDEHGAFEGIISSSDILNALVTDPSDQRIGQNVESSIIKRKNGTFLVDGYLPIDEFINYFSLDEIPWTKREGIKTLGGFFLKLYKRIPSEGDTVEWKNTTLEIIDMDGNRIDKVLLTLKNST
ncbi:hypothetical protein CHS0354_024128 [Potamilus streckersoni]|uniref:Single-stranded-DNA-specific exonuclease RecJ n=1 Tax=Potamilus streckersoni TaxID=2493646 RepID=A0AAE0S002_9BIVA|nr:hypothetical protein CHS0354_024128 [Potamilus streckersoni]